MQIRTVSRIFFTGLAAVLPLVITIAILWWLGSGAERLLGGVVLRLIPNSWYVPGMGILLGVLLTFAIGPLVKTVYGAVQDFMSFISGGGKNFDRVVMVEIEGYRIVGFVTCEDSAALPAPLGDDDRIAVYFPMSYQIGGYTVFIPRSRVTPVEMGMETAMRFVVTAGLSGGQHRKSEEQDPE